VYKHANLLIRNIRHQLISPNSSVASELKKSPERLVPGDGPKSKGCASRDPPAARSGKTHGI
jgi:hypothetical protein